MISIDFITKVARLTHKGKTINHKYSKMRLKRLLMYMWNHPRVTMEKSAKYDFKFRIDL